MRTINKILGITFTAILLMMVKPLQTQAQPGVSVSFQTFYDELSPYGTWVDDPDYGDVWVPDAEEGFKPYATRGHWVVTDYGNTWVSDYEWGWAPFHYGRWRYDDYYGTSSKPCCRPQAVATVVQYGELRSTARAVTREVAHTKQAPI